jgi:hypothetical protein
MVFSEWLGEKLGAAYAGHAFDNAQAAVWSPREEEWPAPTYLATFGMSEPNYAQYESILERSKQMYAGSIILNPDVGELDRVFLQLLLGFEVEWESSLDDESRQALLELIAMLDVMQYRSEIDAADEMVARWEQDLDGGPLLENDIQFILCRQEQVDPDIPHCPLEIDNHPSYEKVESWDFKPLYERYSLFRINP